MLGSNARTGFRSLFPDLDVTDFITNHLLPRMPHHRHGSPGEIELSEEVTEDNLRALISTHKPISGVFEDRKGFIRYSHNLNERAATAFEMGATILFQNGEPFVRHLARDLLRDLGFPHSLLACSAFLTHSGGGSPWHCDTSDNFVIQVLGEKCWSLAPNHQGHHAVKNIWPMAHGSLASIPAIDDSQDITLRPGSVLFLPRNYWHKTKALAGPCFAITVGVNRPTYLALMLSILREQFGNVPEMLEPTGPLLAQDGRAAATIKHLARRVDDLQRRLPHVDLAAAQQQILDAGYMRVRYRVAEGISHAWQTDSSGERVLSVNKGREHLIDLGVDHADLMALVPAILQQVGDFSMQELQKRPLADLDIDIPTLAGMLRKLVVMGILCCQSADQGRDHRDIKQFV
jgi:50S ribosomal protein L16 3-hydroxylase